MVIKTGNTGKLHLRERATTASPSLGLYPNGTVVTVYSTSNGWAQVVVDGKSGFMALQFLSGSTADLPTAPPVNTPVPSMSGAKGYVIQTGNTGRLHLRETPSVGALSMGLYPNGTYLMGVDLGNGWVLVNVYGRYGYMMRKFLTLANGAPQNPVTPPPAPSGNYTTMVVRTGNSGKLHLRENASKASRSLGLYANGTLVQAMPVGNGWALVNVNGRLGYMMLQFLSGSTAPSVVVQPTHTAAPAQPIGTAKTYQKSGSWVNLRSSKGSVDYSNVIAHIPSGTTVTVLEWGTTYTKVSYNGMIGYIITSYLRK